MQSPKKRKKKYEISLGNEEYSDHQGEDHILVDFTISYDFYIVVRGRVHFCHHASGSN